MPLHHLTRFPRLELIGAPTPLEYLPRLSDYLGREIYIKRDDVTPIAMGGNKLRKLEFLVADALREGADTLITAGAIQSNHVRQTAAVAAKLGLHCVALLENPIGTTAENYLTNGNRLLLDLFNTQIEMCDALTDPDAQLQTLATRIEAQGFRPYVIPVGGSSALGAMGYVESALEIAQQCEEVVGLVRETLALLQKIFPIRQCENSVYRNRSRPCLQYQIGRCLGPCVAGLVSEEEYTQQVEYVRLFLSGKDDQVLTQLIARMEKASQDLAFEEAARIRDQIQAVRRVTEKQFVSNAGDDLDVIGVAFDAGMACVHVLFIRQGKVLGSRSYFPKVPGGTELGEVVETFVGQFYLQGSQMRTLPGEILLDFNLSDKTLLADSLSELAGRRIHVQTKPRGDRARYLKLARTNAATALVTKLSQQSTITQRLTALATVLKLPAIKRMECFDISHTMGEQTVASCVVFDANGPLRAEYRRYNIAGITPGDDYAAMNQVLRRRYGKAIEESKIPDVILIDGGKGQLAQAKAVFAELDVPWDKHRPLLLGVAKGADRKAGLETLFFEPEGEGFSLPPDSPALHVIQHIRDESHDHAIGGHRKKRAKVKNTSTLETIEGVGPKRRQMLLKYMGGLQGLRNASVEEIAKVPGISQGLAEKIFWSLKH
ncbi:excinuclease ABC subunit UvrC [Salmonella enterica subsp. enterica]|nr:excinuclease ABC subunit UvrC [Salmonella enterica subsp. enterica]